MKICYSCFKKYSDNIKVCPYCGKEEITKAQEPIYLAPGTILNERYTIGEIAGMGGFGIVYKAYDPVLDTVVAIKEYFVTRLATRAEGLRNVIINKKSIEEYNYRKERFLSEAKTMAKFGSHNSITNVYDYFEENQTAYFVMELHKGASLADYVSSQPGNKVDVDFAVLVANEVGKALKSFHEQNIIHKDIAPDNIFICSGKEIKIKTMDLGAAKLGDETDNYIDLIMKPGYSPPEQYENDDDIGPWSDIYALGATLYRILTGVKPPESTNRKIKDEIIPIHELNPSVPQNLENTIMKALSVDVHMRFKTVDEFLKALNGEKKVRTLANERKIKKIRRAVSIVAAFAIVFCISLKVYNSFTEKRKDADYIQSASIDVWFPVADDDEMKNSNLEIIKNKFISTYKEKNINVQINLVAINENEYESRLREAINNDQMPDLFESTGLTGACLEHAVPLDSIIASERFKACSTLCANYNNQYKNSIKMPLSINVPVAYLVTNGPSIIEYSRSVFDTLDDFGDYNKICIDSNSSDLMKLNYDNNVIEEKDIFAEDVFEKYAVVVSSTDNGEKIAETYAGKYQYRCVFQANNPIALFSFEWSVNDNKNDAKLNAAKKLLEMMLSEDYQTNLCVSTVPVFEGALNSDSNWLSGMKGIYDKLEFKLK